MLTSSGKLKHLKSSYPANWREFCTGKSRTSLAKRGFYFSQGNESSDPCVVCVHCQEKISCQHLSQCQVVSCPMKINDPHCQCQCRPDPMSFQVDILDLDEVDRLRPAGAHEGNITDRCSECNQPLEKVQCGLCAAILHLCKLCFFSSESRRDLIIQMQGEGGLPIMYLPCHSTIAGASSCCPWCETPH